MDGDGSVCALEPAHLRPGQYGVRHRVDRLTFERAVKAERRAHGNGNGNGNSTSNGNSNSNGSSNGNSSAGPQLWHRLMW